MPTQRKYEYDNECFDKCYYSKINAYEMPELDIIKLEKYCLKLCSLDKLSKHLRKLSSK